MSRYAQVRSRINYPQVSRFTQLKMQFVREKVPGESFPVGQGVLVAHNNLPVLVPLDPQVITSVRPAFFNTPITP
jgi:hypothetical protein